jgi:hypothetical protein
MTKKKKSRIFSTLPLLSAVCFSIFQQIYDGNYKVLASFSIAIACIYTMYALHKEDNNE